MEKSDKQKKHENRNDKAKLIAKMQQKKSGNSSPTTPTATKNKPSPVEPVVLKKVQTMLLVIFAVISLVVGFIAHPMQSFFFPALSLPAKLFMDLACGVAIFFWILNFYKKNIDKINSIIGEAVDEKSGKKPEKKR